MTAFSKLSIPMYRDKKQKGDFGIDSQAENNNRGFDTLLDCAFYRCSYTDTADSL
jgi:hypothetical protein